MTTPTNPTPDYPQDAPRPPVHPPTVSLGKQAGDPAPFVPPVGEPTGPPRDPHPQRETTYLPAPTGPSWGTAIWGVVFMVIAAGVILNQVNGFQVSDFRDVGPGVLVGAGLLLALVGGIGMISRRRR